MSPHFSAVTPHFQFQTFTWQRRIAWLFIAVVAYGSLFPPDFDFSAPQPFGWFQHVWPVDIVKNTVLFMPLGLLIASMAQHKGVQRAAFLLRWALGAFALAAGLQIAQMFLPRDPEMMDVLTNMLGLALGYALQPLLWRVVAHAAPQTARRVADPFLSLLAMLWIMAAMFPFLPAWHGRMLQRQLDTLAASDWSLSLPVVLQGGLTWVGAHCLYHALAPLPRLGRSTGLIVGAMFLLALLFKAVGYSQIPSIAALTGMAAGMALWLISVNRWSVRLQHHVTAAVALLLYLTYALWPVQWHDHATRFGLLPFGSLLGNSMGLVLRAYCLEALALGMLVWLLARAWGLTAAVLCTASLGLACEWTQRFLVSRTPEISTLVMVLLLAFFYRACQPVDSDQTSSVIKQ
jgi:glycopeptide antibiotics resistance protein